MLIKKSHIGNLILLVVSISFCLVVAEIGVRALIKDNIGLHGDERNLVYRYDELLGWFPIENSKMLYTGSRSIVVEHNNRGFRDSEHHVGKKPRLVFIGDSFLWGYDVEKKERFTEKLQKLLPEWSVYNLGVSGYGTDQEYLLLEQQHDYYDPSIVFLIFCSDNDQHDNSNNKRYGGYYKPYFIQVGNDLELRGVPVPKSENYFFVNHKILAKSYLVRVLVKKYFGYRNPPHVKLANPTFQLLAKVQNFVTQKGGQFFIGLQGADSELEGFLTDAEIPWVSLANLNKYQGHGKHWTPEGHNDVAQKIYDFLKGEKALNMSSPVVE